MAAPRWVLRFEKLRPIRNRSHSLKKTIFRLNSNFLIESHRPTRLSHTPDTTHRHRHRTCSTQPEGLKTLAIISKRSKRPARHSSACATRPIVDSLRYATPTRRRRRISVFITSGASTIRTLPFVLVCAQAPHLTFDDPSNKFPSVVAARGPTCQRFFVSRPVFLLLCDLMIGPLWEISTCWNLGFGGSSIDGLKRGSFSARL